MTDKTNIKLYICGRVSGDENYQQKFNNAEAELRAAGYTDIVNLARLVPADTHWKEAMRICLKAMLDCDGLAQLPDWPYSCGARVESYLAYSLEVEVKAISEWINGKA
jgi:hypothetical protein